MLQAFLLGVCGVEAATYAYRYANRGLKYRQALTRARALNRPLYIFGAPDRGATGRGIPVPYGYGQPEHGDMVVDLVESACPNAIQWDLRGGLPWLGDASVVVFESCVLEYIEGDPGAVARELRRVSGGELYCVRVEPWCPFTHMVTGSHHLIRPVTTAHRLELAVAPAPPLANSTEFMLTEPTRDFG